jgi:hypothetical protein
MQLACPSTPLPRYGLDTPRALSTIRHVPLQRLFNCWGRLEAGPRWYGGWLLGCSLACTLPAAAEAQAAPGQVQSPAAAQTPPRASTPDRKDANAEGKAKDKAKGKAKETAKDRALLEDSILDALTKGRPQADARPLFVWDFDKTAVAYFVGHVEWQYAYRGQAVALKADRMMLLLRQSDSKEGGEEAGSLPAGKGKRRSGGGKAKEAPDGSEPSEGSEPFEGSEPPKALEQAKASGKDILEGFDPRRWRDFTFYAEGNVRIEVPGRKTFLEADSFFYEHLTGRGIARNARLRTTFQNAEGLMTVFQAKNYKPGTDVGSGRGWAGLTSPLSVHADVLRVEGFERFSGEGIEASTCDFALPHFALSAKSVTVSPVPGEATPGEPAPGRDYIIDPESTWLELSGHEIVPFPVSYWDTRWQSHLPVRSVDFGSSSQFGLFAGLDWNLNYFFGLLPTENFGPLKLIDEKARLGFETTYMEERGFGYGPNAEYGTSPKHWEPWQLQLKEWNYYGQAQYYGIDDQGDEDRSTGLPVPTEDRYWGHVWHRQSVPYLGLVDLEYSKLSDSAFLGEYFEKIAKEEKEQESLVYLRRNILDNLSVTGLYSRRVNDFQSQTERLPEGKLLLSQQPIFQTDLYSDLELQAAYLHKLEDDALGVAPRGYGRYDALNVWSYSLGLSRYFQTLPFALVRMTEYGEVLDEDEGSEDRATFGAGVTVSQEWSRIFRFDEESFLRRFLGIQNLKHVVVPKMTYLNVLSNDLPSEDLIQVDATDQVDLQESFALSLHNAFLTRRPVAAEGPGEPKTVKPLLGNRDGELETVLQETHRLLDSEVSFVLFPHPGRDNEGDRSSAIIFDNTLSPASRLWARAWFDLDPNDGLQARRIDASLTYQVIPEDLTLTVGDRFTSRHTNMVYVLGSWSLSEKWKAEAYYAHDFETQEDMEYNFSLHRIFHRFALSLEYSMDVGEDRNQTVYVNFSPVELLRPLRHGMSGAH